MNSKSQLVATMFYNPDGEWWALVEGRMNKTGHSIDVLGIGSMGVS